MEKASCCRRLIALRCSFGFLLFFLIKSGNLLLSSALFMTKFGLSVVIALTDFCDLGQGIDAAIRQRNAEEANNVIP